MPVYQPRLLERILQPRDFQIRSSKFRMQCCLNKKSICLPRWRIEQTFADRDYSFRRQHIRKLKTNTSWTRAPKNNAHEVMLAKPAPASLRTTKSRSNIFIIFLFYLPGRNYRDNKENFSEEKYFWALWRPIFSLFAFLLSWLKYENTFFWVKHFWNHFHEILFRRARKFSADFVVLSIPNSVIRGSIFPSRLQFFTILPHQIVAKSSQFITSAAATKRKEWSDAPLIYR